MADYRHLFGDGVALGLGLGQPSLPTRDEAIAEYQKDPASAFSRMAEALQPSGSEVPFPFAVTEVTLLDSNPPKHSKE